MNSPRQIALADWKTFYAHEQQQEMDVTAWREHQRICLDAWKTAMAYIRRKIYNNNNNNAR